MKNNIIYYVLIGLGVIALAMAVWWTIGPHHHNYRQYVLYAVAVVLIVGGIVGMFVIKPKNKAAVVAE
jgi:NhaP-type Na+/H+ or K+/H+ antiporter